MKGLYRKCQGCGHAYRRHFALGGSCKTKVRNRFLGGKRGPHGGSHRYSYTRCECPRFVERETK